MNTKISIGDLVEIINWGQLYSSYDEAAKKMNLKHWTACGCPNKDELHITYYVIGEMKHSNFKDETIFGISNGFKDFILSESGLRLIENKYSRPESKIQRFDPQTLYHF